MSVSKKKIFFIYGLGISGLAAALFLKKESYSIFCWDDNSKKRTNAKQKKLNIKNYNSVDFSKIDYVITSPVINHRLKDVSPIIQKAKQKQTKDNEMQTHKEKKTTTKEVVQSTTCNRKSC